MPATISSSEFIGTALDDLIADGFVSPFGTVLDGSSEHADKVNGLQGSDTISTGAGNDLAAGDMVGSEWSYDGEKWVYTPVVGATAKYGAEWDFDDVIVTGAGNDVLLGNGGNDSLSAGSGNDIINAGTGNDLAFGGEGNDTVNLDDGDDYAVGGLGADIVNGGGGNDVIFGDTAGENLLSGSGASALGFAGLAGAGAWSLTAADGFQTVSQSAETVSGALYAISFELAANPAGSASSATVEVLWNGAVIGTVEATAETRSFTFETAATGTVGTLGFRTPETGSEATAAVEMAIGGTTVTVTTFASAEKQFFQVIEDQLYVCDLETGSYAKLGQEADFKLNAIGFNSEDGLIYGVAKTGGHDSLGNKVKSDDIVMIDATGAIYRIGEGYRDDPVGDFDGAGNLWTFDESLNAITKFDVDSFDGNGNPIYETFSFKGSDYKGKIEDVAYDAASGVFCGVEAPNKDGRDGVLVLIDVRNVEAGGSPDIAEIAITGTLIGGKMLSGMPEGEYGSVFIGTDGALYAALDDGNHDMSKSTDDTGALYRICIDAESGEAYLEFVSLAPEGKYSDGASGSAVTGGSIAVSDSAVLLGAASLTLVSGDDDTLRGGEGDDAIHGNAGDDDVNGGEGSDSLWGDAGDDRISAASGDDLVFGGTGNDSLRGEAGDDTMSGGDGADYMDGGAGNDVLAGNDGIDKIVGGTGSDVVEGGAGNDQLWGGNWAADGTADTFVFSSGDGKDFVHDFEVGLDVIDLTAYLTDLESVLAVCSDLGWATAIDTAALDGGVSGDRIILKSVALADLGQDSFIF
ncbi:calcium-binding protein [Mangrovicoccus sp. HB161399]|uniref:calcium-binding protein n=1 Tax=Mangrovicoccus sp. HB161399 TaxID=2720392 RepID=UPI0015549DBE|nr:calcium-binding protein [Mangrovicoccus sp. HB161399]